MKASAPGKLVLWGEYAVLAGAPAAVMALNRFATADIVNSDYVNLSASGYLTPGLLSAGLNFTGQPVASLPEAVLQFWGEPCYPAPWRLHMDTTAFYDSGRKLGIGSSAALCVAVYTALANLCQRPASLAEALQIHHAWQGKAGSGLDVASAWHGGVIAFQAGQVTPLDWPSTLYYQAVWTGKEASTRAHLGQFDQWRRQADTRALTRLSEASTDITRHGPTMDNLGHYIESLAHFDAAAGLNIFTQEHARLATIAHRARVLYKPCGAGGGDIGIAFADSRETLKVFTTTIGSEFTLLPMEIAAHGVQLRD